MPKCLGCEEEVFGTFVSLPGGAVHLECFMCPVCGKDLNQAKGYLPFKGNYVCSVVCRSKAVKDPSLLLQTSKHWRETNSNKAGWARDDDGRAGYQVRRRRCCFFFFNRERSLINE